MDYDILELAPIVAQLVEKYNASGTGSAGKGETEQFMGAIAFCIDEVMKNGAAVEVAAENMSAAQSYVDGLKIVAGKLKETAGKYNAEMANFNHYGNKTLCNTFINEMRPFFDKYDPVFNPQSRQPAESSAVFPTWIRMPSNPGTFSRRGTFPPHTDIYHALAEYFGETVLIEI